MTIKKPSQKDYVKTALRLPPELHAALHEAAAEGERTYNGEILARLRASFKGKRTQQSTTPKENL
ncbi:MAG: hypothetical protein RJB68_2495 [Pseudomonadota bacterium]|jgi:hypothetical protein